VAPPSTDGAVQERLALAVDTEDEDKEIGALVKQGLVVRVIVPSVAVPGVFPSVAPWGKIRNSYAAFEFNRIAGSSTFTVAAESESKV
jgi:hypothetical protein